MVDHIVSINREGQYVVINLKEGLQLATFPSRQQYRNYYYCFRDYLPQDLTPESYQAAHDIGFRLDAGDQTVSSLIRKGLFIPSETASIIECGAYNSWKAIGFSKHIGEKGKVLVLEIDQEQYELARLNLRRNLSEQEFKIMHTGVWHCREERTYTYEHYASHTLNTPDQHSHHSQTSLVKTDTLDNIIDESGIEVFDFINIQTGGSEYESLQGLSRNLNRVKVMWVGSHYTNEGISSRWKSIKLLLEQGCCIYAKKGFEKIHSISEVRQDETGGFYAVTPQYSNILIPTER